ncbi:hypothetical protein F4X10_04260 [Candidatus Poribacteria bacterium]|nr:hypothetical protein [Candidatus Poribacteria bacterium]
MSVCLYIKRNLILKKKYCKECQRLLIEKVYFERNRPDKYRSVCKECRKKEKPFPQAPAKLRREYESKYPRPQIGDSFYCKVCQRTMIVQNNRDVCLDHNHQTGEIRGYICNDCNTGIGKLKDNISMLRRAIQWLKGTLLSIFLN